MKKYLIVACIWLCMPYAGAQSNPLWLYSIPAKTETYYYRVAQATALTEENAQKKAFATAIYESAFAVGVAVDLGKVEQMNEDSLFMTASRYVNIPINMVCQYTEILTTRRGYKAYVLCQIANDARIIPKYKTFNCFLNKEEE